jgi:hypothetical protein
MITVASETTAYITVVGEDHLLSLPDSIPTGATVAVVILPSSDTMLAQSEREETVRQAHFAAVMEAINAVASKPAPADQYTDAELDAIIEKARKAPRRS